ncbi:MAG: glutamyl-tRNA reductase [Deltaproteobacteria bacterium]|nr:glutamyl-tRNA reductase [Deltaproteobacteria bacterium]
MERLINIGMTHETAPVAIRECLATDADNVTRVLTYMRDHKAINEGLFVSTCNRVETLFTSDEPGEAKAAVIAFISDLAGMTSDAFRTSLFTLEGVEAARHIFQVASSLDSMVIGEPQILGQIKEAYHHATRARTSGVILNRLMHRAFHVAKRVRSETGISSAAVSISYAAVELAKKIFHNLEGKKALLIGAGEMAELAARNLLSNGVSAMAVANRTFERALRVAELFNAKAVSFEEIGYQLGEVDIVITSTAATGYVITRSQVKDVLRKRRNRPLFFIDIAVPRDVEPVVNDLHNVYVYDIDDLKGVIEVNMAQRQEEAVKAQRIVDEEVVKFEKWIKTLSVVPTIVALRNKAETIVQSELKRSRSALGNLTEAQQMVVETLTRSAVEKVLNDPILFLKGRADRPTLNAYLDTTKRLFGLNSDKGDGH